MLSQKCTFTVLLICPNSFTTPYVRGSQPGIAPAEGTPQPWEGNITRQPKARHGQLLSSDSKRYLFALKCKPGKHFLLYRCFSLWYSRRYQTCHWVPRILFTVMVLISGGLKQPDFGYCLVLLCVWETCSSSLLDVSSQKYVGIHRICSLFVCSHLRLLNRNAFNASSYG